MKWIGIIGVALVLVPAALAQEAPAPAVQQSAQRDCRQQLSQMGASVFRAAYGNGASAFGRCVSKFARLERENLQAASASCQKERASDAVAFKAKYGQAGLGKCVSQQRRAASHEDVAAAVSAARSCKSERAADPAAFRAKYGSGPHKAGAFARCGNAPASPEAG
jgi:hypothetical protein